jgi:hypothetical protein
MDNDANGLANFGDVRGLKRMIEAIRRLVGDAIVARWVTWRIFQTYSLNKKAGISAGLVCWARVQLGELVRSDSAS